MKSSFINAVLCGKRRHVPGNRLMCCLIYFLAFLWPELSFSQDGTLISRQAYHIQDSDIVKLKKRYPDYDSITRQTALSRIIYESDGLKVAGYLAVPSVQGSFPCIIYCRGGNREFGSLDNPFELFFLQKMASWGYVVIASQYRGCCGSEGSDEFGGNDIHDVLNLMPALKGMNHADTSRMGIYGWSRGGMMTYLALKSSNRFKAAVVGAGPTNLYTNITARKDSFEYYVYAQLIPEYYRNKDKELRKRSAIFWADSLSKSTPLLLLHGSADWRVTSEESLEMVNKLYASKHPVKFVFYPGGDHGLREYRQEADDETKKWFDEYLKKNKALPNMEKHGR